MNDTLIYEFLTNFTSHRNLKIICASGRTAISKKPVVGCPGLPREKTEDPLDVLNIGLWLNIRFLRISIINIAGKTQRAEIVTP